MPEPPGKVLDRDGKTEIGAQPAEFGGDGNLENAESGPDRKADHQDDTTDDQDGGKEGRAVLVHAADVTRRKDGVNSAIVIARISFGARHGLKPN